MLVVAQVAGRLPGQARGPQRTHKQIVQQVDAAEVEMPAGQDPPRETDAGSDRGDCYVRVRDTEELSVGQHVLEPCLAVSADEQDDSTLHSR